MQAQRCCITNKNGSCIGKSARARLLPVCMVSSSQLCTSCLSTLKAGPAPGAGPTLAAPSSSARASHFSTAATARWYSFSCTHTHRCAPAFTTCTGPRQVSRHVSDGFTRPWATEGARVLKVIWVSDAAVIRGIPANLAPNCQMYNGAVFRMRLHACITLHVAARDRHLLVLPLYNPKDGDLEIQPPGPF